MRCYYKTNRAAALEILGRGFSEANVIAEREWHGVPLYADPRMGNPLLDVDPRTGDVRPLFEVVAVNDVPVEWAEGVALDLKEWERVPLGGMLPDNFGLTVLGVSFPDDVSLDDYEWKVQVQIRNRRTGEVRETGQWQPNGEFLVPLDVAQRADVRLLEASVDEDFLREVLARWRQVWEVEHVTPEEIERRLAEMEERVHTWNPDGEEDR